MNRMNLAGGGTGGDSDVNNDNVASISSMMMNYLSPEYISCSSKKATFSESDIEKVSDIEKKSFPSSTETHLM